VVKDPFMAVEGEGATLESPGDAKPWDDGGGWGLSVLLSPAPLPLGGGTCRWFRKDAPFLADYYQLVPLLN